MLRLALPSLVLVAALCVPASGQAQEREPERSSSMDGVSLLSYGFRGFWTGAELGLATGYLTTGTHFEHGEWRKLVLGAGIGAVLGVGAGIALALVDAREGEPGTGWYVLRDIGYASMLGALTGAAVGALFLVGSGHPRDVLVGLSVGTLIGAGVGAVFGVIEGANAKRHRDARRAARGGVHLTLVAVPTAGVLPALGPGVAGRF
ncbi:MAG: hypothetical protein ACHQ53_15945 [Polyangiales bacterium]